MADKLRVAVIGTGYLGRFHALIYSRMSDVELVGVVDTDADRVQEIAGEAGCPGYTDAAALEGLVDAVSIVVPTTAHLAVAAPFLRLGVHTLMEKPIAATFAGGAEIVRLAEASGVILQIGHLERYNAGVMALAQRISEPLYIEAQRMGGFVERATDVDVVSDLMIHDIDIILSLVGSEVQDIAAVGTPVLTEHVDIASARLSFANGAVANVVASRVSDKPMRRIRIFQRKAYLSLDFVEQTIDIAQTRLVEGRERPEIHRERVQVDPVKPLDEELAAFVACVREGRTPLVSGQVGLKALQVAIEVQRSIGA